MWLEKRKLSRCWVCCAGVVLASGFASPVAAQQHDPAAAQALFEQAKQLSRQGKYDAACPKLVESNRLDPGIGTQFHLADCYEQSGRIASAWAAFLDVVSVARSSRQTDREQAAQSRASRLEARLPRLLVTVPRASQVPGLELRRDGVLVGPAQWDTPVPLDPGEHQLVASAPNRRPLTRTLRIEEGKTALFELPVLEPETSAAAAGPAPSPPQAGAAPPPAPTADSPAPKASAGRSAWPLVLGSAGIVGLGVGTTFAFLARSKNEESKADCDPKCGPEGMSLRNAALDRGNIATVGFIAGGVLLAGAGVAWLLDGSSSSNERAAGGTGALKAHAALGPKAATVYVQGSF